MSHSECYAAFDLGAESGRAILGRLSDGRLELHEVCRFPTGGVRVLDSLHWDVLHIWEELKHGLARIATECKGEVAGIGVDTWGLDFALLDDRGALLGLPYHYRDNRTDAILDVLRQHMTKEEIYHETGLPFTQISTLCQLLAMRVCGSPALDVAHSLLMMADLFNFWLTGRQATESTLIGTSQLHSLAHRGWEPVRLTKLGLPTSILQQVIPAGTAIGALLPSVGKEVGLGRISVIAPACHDTLLSRWPSPVKMMSTPL